ncbi:hypothetical protein HOLleu_00899 [Holothuria leucospilota]|uniref:Uncharacterized protein n=1 Tax=Holothuria leucospilota TaxID=206669 RepID=A0A9Q1CNM6_HOLLE|nr:hypothetical protein HOLleu_00899 [Holothuria leucospilota]
MTRDRIVCGINDNTTRKKLLQTTGLDLTKCIDICKVAETTSAQVKDMTGDTENSVKVVKHTTGT